VDSVLNRAFGKIRDSGIQIQKIEGGEPSAITPEAYRAVFFRRGDRGGQLGQWAQQLKSEKKRTGLRRSISKDK